MWGWLEQHTIAVAAVAAGALTLLAFLKKAAWPAVKAVWRGVSDFIQFWLDLLAMPGIVKKELRTNGGQSLKDTVRRLEMYVLNNEAKSRILLNQSDIPVFEAEPDNDTGTVKTVWVNRAYSRAFGMGVSEIQAGAWSDIIHDHDRKRVEKEWSDAVSKKSDFFSRWRFLKPIGGWGVCECRAYVTLLPCGTVGCYIGFATVENGDDGHEATDN